MEKSTQARGIVKQMEKFKASKEMKERCQKKVAQKICAPHLCSKYLKTDYGAAYIIENIKAVDV